jgi:hypothetical protein
MNDKAMNNLMAKFFALAIFACVLSAGSIVFADEPEATTDSDSRQLQSYTENPGEIGDIAKRAEAEVKEVNETSEHEKEKLEAVKREQYFEDNKEEPAGSLLTKDDIAALENKRAENERTIRAKADSAIESIATEQTVQEQTPPSAASPRPVSQTSSRGMVNGIVFYENRGAALIAGEVVREGDVVMGVKVVKITPDFVEFDKQGNQWKQQVGQSPPAAVWEQPQP